jgi:hypothetical protein
MRGKVTAIVPKVCALKKVHFTSKRVYDIINIYKKGDGMFSTKNGAGKWLKDK